MKKPLSPGAALDLRLRYQKARIIAESNEKVRAAWEASRYPRTDQQKRVTLLKYYDVLFSKILALDRGLAPLVEKARKEKAALLTQTHISPTVTTE